MQKRIGIPALFRDSAAELTRLPSLVAAALLMALGLALSSVRIDITPTLRISFAFLANAMIGMLFGPVVSMLTGGIGDILGFLIHPSGPYFPGITITAVLSGLLYGVFLYHSNARLSHVIAAKTSVTLLSNILLNTFWTSILYGKAFMAILPLRITKNLVMLPIEIVMLFVLGKTVQKIYDTSVRRFGAQRALR